MPMDETIAPDAQGLSRRRAGAHRQCGGASKSRTTPMAASFSPRCRCSSTAACRGWAMRRCSGCWNRWAPKRGELALEPDAGIWEYRGRSASTPIRSRCAGPAAPPGGDRAPARACRSRRALERRRRARHPGACCRSAWNPKSAKPSRPRSAPTISTPASCCCPISA